MKFWFWKSDSGTLTLWLQFCAFLFEVHLIVCLTGLPGVRMSTESEEERSVEVLALSEEVDEELLCLYFENKRRSGGGPLELQRKDGRTVLVFEEAQGKMWPEGLSRIMSWCLWGGCSSFNSQSEVQTLAGHKHQRCKRKMILTSSWFEQHLSSCVWASDVVLFDSCRQGSVQRTPRCSQCEAAGAKAPRQRPVQAAAARAQPQHQHRDGGAVRGEHDRPECGGVHPVSFPGEGRPPHPSQPAHLQRFVLCFYKWHRKAAPSFVQDTSKNIFQKWLIGRNVV